MIGSWAIVLYALSGSSQILCSAAAPCTLSPPFGSQQQCEDKRKRLDSDVPTPPGWREECRPLNDVGV
jgi:hypothetical protein